MPRSFDPDETGLDGQSGHDAFFKASLGTQMKVAAAHLRDIMPPAAQELVAFEDLEPVSGELVTLAGERRLDLLLRAPLKLTAAEAVDVGLPKEVLVLLVLEHQSSVDRRMPLRLAEYKAMVWRRFLDAQPGYAWRLPPVFVSVLYSGPGRWTAAPSVAAMVYPSSAREAFREWLDHATYHVLEVGQWRDPGPGLDPAVRAMRWAMGLVRKTRDARAIGRAIEGFNEGLTAAADAYGAAQLRVLFWYLYRVSGITDKEVTVALQRAKAKEAVLGAAMTGWEKMEARAFAKGAASTLLKQIELRFSPPSEEVRQRVLSASSEEIDTWCGRIFSAKSVEELLA